MKLKAQSYSTVVNTRVPERERALYFVVGASRGPVIARGSRWLFGRSIGRRLGNDPRAARKRAEFITRQSEDERKLGRKFDRAYSSSSITNYELFFPIPLILFILFLLHWIENNMQISKL